MHVARKKSPEERTEGRDRISPALSPGVPIYASSSLFFFLDFLVLGCWAVLTAF